MLELFLRLLKDRSWWLGSAVAAIGFVLQAAALGLGSVLLVQALLVTSLLFALPINARIAHRRVTRWEWTWAAAAGRVGRGDRHRRQSDRGPLAGVAGDVDAGGRGAGPAAGGVRGGARTSCAGPVSAVLLAFVSGALWGLFAVLTKGVVDLLGDGIGALLRSPELYAWAAVAIAGTAWQQSSFRAGALTASLPTMTVTEPIVGSLLGVVVLGETLRPGDAGWFVLVVAIVVMVVAAGRAGPRRGGRAARRSHRGLSVTSVLTAVAIIPSAPVLVPELAGAAAAELADLRAAVRRRPPRCRSAGSPSASAPGAPASGPQAAGTFAGYGADVRGGVVARRARRSADCRCAR